MGAGKVLNTYLVLFHGFVFARHSTCYISTLDCRWKVI